MKTSNSEIALALHEPKESIMRNLADDLAELQADNDRISANYIELEIKYEILVRDFERLAKGGK